MKASLAGLQGRIVTQFTATSCTNADGIQSQSSFCNISRNVQGYARSLGPSAQHATATRTFHSIFTVSISWNIFMNLRRSFTNWPVLRRQDKLLSYAMIMQYAEHVFSYWRLLKITSY